jgi:hypothetical protein
MCHVADGDDEVEDENSEKNHVKWRIEPPVVLEALRFGITHVYPSFL